MHYEKIEPTEKYPFKIFIFQMKDLKRQIPSHWHESGELLYCLSGELEVVFPNQTFILQAGDPLFINSNIVHSSRSLATGYCLAIQFPLRYLQTETEGGYGENFLFDLTPKVLDFEVTNLLKSMLKQINSDSLSSHLSIKSKVLSLIAELYERSKIPVTHIQGIKSLKYLKRLKTINEYIQEHFQEELSIQEVATIFNYNASYFSRFYKKYMGITFSDFLTSLRLEVAYRSLRDTDATILEISYLSGFATVKAFYNSFKKNYGLSPQQYRVKYLKKVTKVPISRQ